MGQQQSILETTARRPGNRHSSLKLDTTSRNHTISLPKISEDENGNTFQINLSFETHQLTPNDCLSKQPPPPLPLKSPPLSPPRKSIESPKRISKNLDKHIRSSIFRSRTKNLIVQGSPSIKTDILNHSVNQTIKKKDLGCRLSDNHQRVKSTGSTTYKSFYNAHKDIYPKTGQHGDYDSSSIQAFRKSTTTLKSGLLPNRLYPVSGSRKEMSNVSHRNSVPNHSSEAKMVFSEKEEEKIRRASLSSCKPTKLTPNIDEFKERKRANLPMANFQPPNPINECLPPQRTATPNDQEYRHIGAFKLGSLRITNGAASPAPSRERCSENENSKSHTHDQKTLRDINQSSGNNKNKNKSNNDDKYNNLSTIQLNPPALPPLPSLTHECINEQFAATSSSSTTTSNQKSSYSKTDNLSKLNTDMHSPPRMNCHMNDLHLSDYHFNDFHFEDFDLDEKLSPTQTDISQPVQIWDDAYQNPSFSSPSFFESPELSPPIPPTTKLSLAVRDQLFDEEPWTPTISPQHSPNLLDEEIVELVKPLAKADSGYRSNVSSQLTTLNDAKQVSPLSDEENLPLPSTTSRTFSFASSISSSVEISGQHTGQGISLSMPLQSNDPQTGNKTTQTACTPNIEREEITLVKGLKNRTFTSLDDSSNNSATVTSKTLKKSDSHACVNYCATNSDILYYSPLGSHPTNLTSGSVQPPSPLNIKSNDTKCFKNNLEEVAPKLSDEKQLHKFEDCYASVPLESSYDVSPRASKIHDPLRIRDNTESAPSLNVGGVGQMSRIDHEETLGAAGSCQSLSGGSAQYKEKSNSLSDSKNRNTVANTPVHKEKTTKIPFSSHSDNFSHGIKNTPSKSAAVNLPSTYCSKKVVPSRLASKCNKPAPLKNEGETLTSLEQKERRATYQFSPRSRSPPPPVPRWNDLKVPSLSPKISENLSHHQKCCDIDVGHPSFKETRQKLLVAPALSQTYSTDTSIKQSLSTKSRVSGSDIGKDMKRNTQIETTSEDQKTVLTVPKSVTVPILSNNIQLNAKIKLLQNSSSLTPNSANVHDKSMSSESKSIKKQLMSRISTGELDFRRSDELPNFCQESLHSFSDDSHLLSTQITVNNVSVSSNSLQSTDQLKQIQPNRLSAKLSLSNFEAPITNSGLRTEPLEQATDSRQFTSKLSSSVDDSSRLQGLVEKRLSCLKIPRSMSIIQALAPTGSTNTKSVTEPLSASHVVPRQEPQRQEWRRRSSTSSRPASPISPVSSNSLVHSTSPEPHEDLMKKKFARRSGVPKIPVSTEDNHNTEESNFTNGGRINPRDSAPNIFRNKTYNSSRGNYQGSYPPQVHATRRSYSMIASQSVPRVQSFYDYIENIQHQTQNSSNSSHPSSQTQQTISSEKTTYVDVKSSKGKLRRNSAAEEGSSLDRDKMYAKTSHKLRQTASDATLRSTSQMSDNSITIIDSLHPRKSPDPNSRRSTLIEVTSVLPQEYSKDQISKQELNEDMEQELSINSDIHNEKLSKDSILNRGRPISRAVETTLLSKMTETHLIPKQLNIQKIETEYNSDNSENVKKFEQLTQPPKNANSMYRNSIDSLPSQKMGGQRIISLNNSSNLRNRSVSVYSDPDSKHLRKDIGALPLEPLFPEDNLRTWQDNGTSRSSESRSITSIQGRRRSTINHQLPSGACFESPPNASNEGRRRSTINFQSSPGVILESISNECTSGDYSDIENEFNSKNEQEFLSKAGSSLDSLPSQCKNLKPLKSRDSLQLIPKFSEQRVIDSHSTKKDTEGLTRSPSGTDLAIYDQREKIKPSTCITNYSGQGQILKNSPIHGRNPLQSNNFPTIPKSISSYYQPDTALPLLPHTTGILDNHGNNGLATTSSYFPSPNRCLSKQEERDILVLNSGWKKSAAFPSYTNTGHDNPACYFSMMPNNTLGNWTQNTHGIDVSGSNSWQ